MILDAEARFFAKVHMGGVCWEWTASLSVDGYGRFSIQDKTVYAHRWIWERLVGPIPKGLRARPPVPESPLCES